MRRFAPLLAALAVLASAAAASFDALRGRVLSLEGKPVAGASLKISGSGSAGAVTGADGAFALEAGSSGRVRLVVRHPAYYEETIAVDAAGPSEVVIRLTPLIRQAQDITVTALRRPEPLSKAPAAQTVVSSDVLSERMPTNITEALAEVAGLAPLGSGGFSLVPSIRGLARGRILLLLDGCRIASDRRTGPNASFVSPTDLERIEVLRSPSSIFYGSDAVGGVVQMFTAEPPPEDGIHGRLQAGYGTINDEASYGLRLAGRRGAWGFTLSGQGWGADAYRSPSGEVLQSQYGQKSLSGKVAYETEARAVSLGWLLARGTDIGKPTRTSATKPTWYPRENQNLFHLSWKEKSWAGGELSLGAYANPNFLETRTQTISAAGSVTKDSFSRTESAEVGAHLAYTRRLGRSLRLTAGLDGFGRLGAAATLREDSFSASGAPSASYAETSYDRGLRRDLGLYISAEMTGLSKLALMGGLRLDSIVQSAHPGGEAAELSSRKTPLTGFLAASFELTPRLLAFVDAASAYRTPGLGELFYTGITGRGMIIAQPDLASERSLSGNAGLKWIGERVFAAAYAFEYDVDGLIDRVLVAPQVYTYLNVEKARIRGLEVEAEVHPAASWMVFSSLAWIDGRSRTTGQAINDIPPLRLNMGGRLFLGRFSAEIDALLQARKSEPGPAEISLPSYSIFSFRADWSLPPVRLFLVAGNLGNAAYIGRPDPDAMPEPGRGVKLGASWSF